MGKGINELAKARIREGRGRTGRRGWGVGRRDGNGEGETWRKEWGQGDGEGAMVRGETGKGGGEGATGRGRRGKKREDFTDGYDGMPGWT